MEVARAVPNAVVLGCAEMGKASPMDVVVGSIPIGVVVPGCLEFDRAVPEEVVVSGKLDVLRLAMLP